MCDKLTHTRKIFLRRKFTTFQSIYIHFLLKDKIYFVSIKIYRYHLVWVCERKNLDD